MAEVVPRAVARVAVEDAEVVAVVVAIVAAAGNKAMVKADDDVAAAAGHDEVTAAIWNQSRTATFRASQDKVCSSFTRTDTASCGVPKTITPVNGAIRSFPVQ